MYKLFICSKCKGTFIVTSTTENTELCDNCKNEITRSLDSFSIKMPLHKKIYRNIVILSCKLDDKYKDKNNNSYIELIGFDLFEKKVVKLVDENGKKYGLHTYKKEIVKLRHGDVISVLVEFIDDIKCINMFRICNAPEMYEHTDFIQLWENYKSNYNYDICWSFNELLSINGYDEVYSIVYFSGTQIKKYKDKLQITFITSSTGQIHYVDCLDKTRKTGEFKNGNYLKGLCLLKATKRKNNNGYEYRMIKNMAKVIDEGQIKKDSKFNTDEFFESIDAEYILNDFIESLDINNTVEKFEPLMAENEEDYDEFTNYDRDIDYDFDYENDCEYDGDEEIYGYDE